VRSAHSAPLAEGYVPEASSVREYPPLLRARTYAPISLYTYSPFRYIAITYFAIGL